MAFSDFTKWFFKYPSAGDAAQAFWMPGAYAADQNMRMTMLTNTSNRSNIEFQNQANLDQWRRENEYNDPINMMQRMRSAGLNPALMYGAGSSIATSAPSPMLQGARDIAPQMAGYDSPLDALMKLAQIRNINAQTDNTDSKTRTENETRQLIVENLSASIASLHQQNAESIARINNLAKQGELTDAQIHQINESIDQTWHSLFNDDERLKNETALNYEQIKVLKADVRKKLADAKVSERQLLEMIETFTLRKLGLQHDNDLKVGRISEAYATARKLGLEANEIEQMINIRTPEELYSAQASRRQGTFGHADKSSGYVLGDFLQFLVESAFREVGHAFH